MSLNQAPPPAATSASLARLSVQRRANHTCLHFDCWAVHPHCPCQHTQTGAEGSSARHVTVTTRGHGRSAARPVGSRSCRASFFAFSSYSAAAAAAATATATATAAAACCAAIADTASRRFRLLPVVLSLAATRALSLWLLLLLPPNYQQTATAGRRSRRRSPRRELHGCGGSRPPLPAPRTADSQPLELQSRPQHGDKVMIVRHGRDEAQLVQPSPLLFVTATQPHGLALAAVCRDKVSEPARAQHCTDGLVLRPATGPT